MKGKKILHLDRNDHYGGECSSLNITQLYRRFRPGMKPPSSFGKDKEYNIDLIPKFMMADEELVRVLVHTDVTRYIEFRQISGSFVLKDKRLVRVPAGPEEVTLKDFIFGMFEMYKLRSFLSFLDSFEFENPSTYSPFTTNPALLTMQQVYDQFGLGNSARELVGHSLALYNDDEYLGHPADETFKRIHLYKRSALRFGKSPYIYPSYGLSELPQGFARLSAIYGGTYMLETPFDGLVHDESTGKLIGIKSGQNTVNCSAIIADPSYFPERVKTIGRVIRAICLLQHPIPHTNHTDSAQIIIPRSQAGRKYDIYIANISASHFISPPGIHVAIVSTIVEGNYPELEIKPGLDLLGVIADKFVYLSDLFVPLDDGCESSIFISKSMDATTHFETVYKDVADLYKRITGEQLVIPKRESQDDQ